MSYSLKSKRVFVGLSGGVDSAVSAALLKKDGWDVTGVFIRIAVAGLPCPAAEDRRDAMRAAAHLGIPFREIDLSKEYERRVFDAMLREYAAGDTPNPDTLCNREIKFGLFYDFAMNEGADRIATGHYARVSEKDGETHLLAGADPNKDQSYFLWDVPGDKFRRTLFPVGGMQKTRVRALAAQMGLPNARRKDSQGLCFLGDIGLVELLKRRLSPKPGDVLNETGAIVGRHEGAALYTIGERRGLSVNASSPEESPHYVIGKDMGRNTITVSSVRPADRRIIPIRETNWIGTVIPGKLMARTRYRQPLQDALLTERNEVCFDSPIAAAPGQSLVLYDRERCLGGGIIA